MANITIDQLTGKTSVATDQLEVQATAGGASNKVTVASAVGAGAANLAPAANTKAVGVTGYSLTGADATSMVDLDGTWSTTGTPTAIKLNITNTASNAASKLLDLQVGGFSRFYVGDGIYIGRVGSTQNFRIYRAGTVSTLYSDGLIALYDGSYTGMYGGNAIIFSRETNATIYVSQHVTDIAVRSLTLRPQAANDAAVTNIVGGTLICVGGAGASSSAAAANGGNVTLDGGQGYGTGVAGNIIIGATRGNLVTAPKTFGALPTAASAGAGARSYITDGVASPVFSAAAAGGGTLGTPVYSDGTTWRNG